MAVQVRQPWHLSYGNIGVDFVNTRWNRLKPHPVESLCQIQDVLDWLQCKRLLNEARQQPWSLQFAAAPSTGQRVLQKALQLREALYNIFWSMANHCPPQGSDVEAVNALLAAAIGPPMLRARPDGGFALEYPYKRTPTAALLGPIVSSAATLLSEGDLQRLRRCGNRACGKGLFDHTKNQQRRWCHMQSCGSMVKMRRYRARQQHQDGSHRAMSQGSA
jgi:predicted RNA-binding Zn ribbon-like protein